jgi:MarR family 2-MHQ and catechol resistance regulon transcriptional repressor
LTVAKIYQHSGPHLFLVFWRASHAVLGMEERRVGGEGFRSLSDFAILELLLHCGALSIRAIGDKVLLTSGSITTAVQRLEARALIRRTRSKGDGRVILIDLTEKGRGVIETASRDHGATVDALFAEFSREERALFARLMGRLEAKAKAMEAAAQKVT